MNYEPFLRSELVPLRLILDEIPRYLDERGTSARASKDGPYSSPPFLTSEQAYAVAQIRIVESLLHVLNAIVDASLLALANSLQSEAGEADLKRPRAALLRELEDTLQTKAGLHPGWDQVNSLREEANAIKHRGGILGIAPDPATGLPWVQTVKTSVELARSRIEGVEIWLSSIARLVQHRGPGRAA